MPGRQTPCEIAWRGVSSFVGFSFDFGMSCFDSGVEDGSTGIAEGAIVEYSRCELEMEEFLLAM